MPETNRTTLAAFRGLFRLEPPQEVPVLTAVCQVCAEEIYLQPSVGVVSAATILADHLWTAHMVRLG